MHGLGYIAEPLESTADFEPVSRAGTVGDRHVRGEVQTMRAIRVPRHVAQAARVGKYIDNWPRSRKRRLARMLVDYITGTWFDDVVSEIRGLQ